jgi:dolichyl-diphosphooligosaccharide--protein glycosyltransferase
MANVGEGNSSKDRVVNGLKSFSKLRFQLNHGSILVIASLILILFIAFTLRILPIRWEIPSGTIHLNEFDPYYQLTITRYMVQNGLLSPYYPTPWINPQHFFPWGLDMSKSLPALPMTGAVIFQIVSFFGVNVDLMSFLSVLTVVLGTLACLIIYFVGKDMGGRAVGLFSALFFALAPSFLQRSSLGFYDTEIPGVLGLVLFIFLFLRSIDQYRSLRSSLTYSIGAGLALAYFIAGWGAAYFMLDLTALFVFVLVILKRYNQRLLLGYSVTFGIALLIATKVPYIGLSYLTTGPVVPVLGVFIVLVIAEILRHNISARTKLTIAVATFAGIVLTFVPLWVLGYFGAIAGKFISVLDPFARAAAPLIESVAEHRISAWGNLYIELGVGILFFLIGLYFVLKNPTNRNIFLVIFGATSLYFAASMVRLLVIFAPAYAIIMAIGVLGVLKPFFTLLKEAPNAAIKTKRRIARVSKEYSGLAIFLIFIIVVTNVAFSPQSGGMPRVYSSAYVPTSISSSSLPIAPNEPVPEWLNMLSYTQNNIHSTDVVVAWWDYGDWLSILGNVTTLADNTTVNSTQIENVGFVFMGNETQALKMLTTYDQSRTQYILIFLVLQISQQSNQQIYVASPAGLGDEGKWSWMARISGEASQRLINASYMDQNSAWTDENAFGIVNNQTSQWQWNAKGMDSVIYKLMSFTEERYCNNTGGLVQPHALGIEPVYFKEQFIAGLDQSPFQYGIVPLVALFKIDWAAYNNAMSTTG